MANIEIPLERQDSAEEAKQADKSKKEEAHPPLLIEFMTTLSAVILVIVFFTVVGISLTTSATLLDFVIRTSISILVIGGLLITIVRQISSSMLSADREIQPDESNEFEA